MFTALFWKKVWVWVKHHWYVPVIIILLFGFSLTKSNIKSKLYKLLTDQKDLYEKEKDLIEKTSKEKELEKDLARKRHEELVRRLEEEYNIELEKLKRDKQKELANLTEEYRDSEEELAKRIAAALGAEYVKPGGE
tara:strand:- start:102 stop:509 length:408 start_codon:yes stop_codon:yes gene_type:complete